MSDRRAARGSAKAHAAAAGGLPAELMMGPCLEVWFTKRRKPEGAPVGWPAYEARRRWREAVQLWAEESGWVTENRRWFGAMNLARTRIPWSREYLIAQGRAELVEFYEGRSDTRSDVEFDGWASRVGPLA